MNKLLIHSKLYINTPSSTSLIGSSIFPDLNECEAMPEFCHHARCENNPGSFRCICDKGFQLNRYGNNCTGAHFNKLTVSSLSKSRDCKEGQVHSKKRKVLAWMSRCGRHVPSQCPKQKYFPPLLVAIFNISGERGESIQYSSWAPCS